LTSQTWICLIPSIKSLRPTWFNTFKHASYLQE
jgi:uncharacterized membrane protein